MTSPNPNICQVAVAEPIPGPLEAIANGYEVTLHISAKETAYAVGKFAEIMKAEPAGRWERWSDNGGTPEDLKIATAAFLALARTLPMNAWNYLRWLEFEDCGAGHLDDYVVHRLARASDEELADLVQRGLGDRNLDALGLERIDEPVSMSRRKREIGL